MQSAALSIRQVRVMLMVFCVSLLDKPLFELIEFVIMCYLSIGAVLESKLTPDCLRYLRKSRNYAKLFGV